MKESTNRPSVQAIVMSIDDSVNMLTDILKNKGGMYAPDAEWTACRLAIGALEKAKELIIDSLGHNASLTLAGKEGGNHGEGDETA
jgi:hypothetical protein